MKLKFDPSLDYQLDAVNSVLDVFDGQPLAQSNFAISHTTGDLGMMHNEWGVGNNLLLNDERILNNVQAIQERNDIEKVTSLQKGRDFSIEMETGTGKTYVYLRTIFELSKNYGFKKFIIVVPSVAVREGVLKSIEMTRDHFNALYNNTPFDAFVYDSARLNRVRQFAASNHIQIMIINIQAFQRDVESQDLETRANVINRENDKMSGYKPIEYIQATHPMVIIDEPQSVDNTEKAQNAIANLNATTILRYSATHRNPYNLLYKLDPIKAYDLKLVKRIEVASIRSDDNFNDAYVKLLKTDNKNGIRAQVEIHKKGKSGTIKPTKLWVKCGKDLYEESGELEIYRQGYRVINIDCTPGIANIELSQGNVLRLGEEMGGMSDDIMKAQVHQTIEQHLKKERALKGQDIKVLSLFFIDKVANYRAYNDDNSTKHKLGKIGEWFEEAFQELRKSELYKDLESCKLPVDKIHDGYFSQDKKYRWKDSTERGSKNDDETYNLIMREKERLLDQNEPLRFIFSHSALREGWDNPNVFQICTLNETRSTEKKRQEIGRGLRLPVNSKGERVHDENVNRLTVIANESYEGFARTLQNEFEEDCHIKFGRVEKIAFAKLINPHGDKNQPIGQEHSAQIWNILRQGGYLNADGEIRDKFNPKEQSFDMHLPQEYEPLKHGIIDVMNKKIFKNRVVNARKREIIRFNKQVQLSDDFKLLWDKIKQRTRYRVKFGTNKLIQNAVKRIKDTTHMPRIEAITLMSQTVGVDLTEAGVETTPILQHRKYEAVQVKELRDILAHLQKETELTRDTLVKILKQSGRLREFKINPYAFMVAISREINHALHELMLDGIQYEKISGHYWEMSRLEPNSEAEMTRYLSNLYELKHAEKSIYDWVECDSEVERQFAKALDNNENVKLFIKLPVWFKIDTPIGPYNPDWAFMTEREKKLYFVRETKSTLDSEERHGKENQKIRCGHRHFETIDVNYRVVTKLEEVDF